jgi:sulfite reductase (NADPH) flavoprotein alpha-component
MAQAVDEALVAILGAVQVEQLADQQRYCRDVY